MGWKLMQYFSERKGISVARILAFVGCLIFLATSFASPSLVIIGNAQTKISKLTKSQLASLYMGRPISVGKGVSVTPYDQAADSTAYRTFYKNILGWNASNVSGYWSSQMFSGSGGQPDTVSNAQQAIAMVEKNPHAIAYVMSNQLQNLGSKVKVLYGHYTPSAKPVYRDNAYFHGAGARNNKRVSNDSGYHTMSSRTASAPQNLPAVTPSNNSSLRSDLARELSAIGHHTKSQDNYHAAVNSNVGVWQTIQQHIQLGRDANNIAVRREVDWFLSHRSVLRSMLNNATPYIQYVYSQSQLRHMPAKFALLPMMESDYNPNAYSRAGAAGLWQMMPATASCYGLNINWWYDARRDIITSTNAALNYLVRLHHEQGDWNLAAASYDVGPGAVQKAIDYNRRMRRPVDFWALPLPTETRNYVPKLLALATIIKNAKQYHVNLPYVPNKPFFVAFKMNTQMDMAELSRYSGVPTSVLHTLNPGMRRWATPPSHYNILIPTSNAKLFRKNLADMVGKRHISWQYHEMHSGENLYTIAHNYHTSVSLLRKVNHLDSNAVAPGVGILVPLWLNHTYKAASGVLNLADNSVMSNASVVNPAREPILPKSVTAMPNINTQLPASITAGDILSGKLPSNMQTKNQTKGSVTGRTTEQPQASSAAASTAASANTRISNSQPQLKQQPISSRDSLKSLMQKIYGKQV